ncbi:MAG: CYTH domain-containing protein, partial [Nocardioidaceae bacterium]|nr:CYTH domain-containing protein [Nocardioidaceae bacterium]
MAKRGPGSHLEIETKYDVDADVDLPDLSGLPDVDAVLGPTEHDLEATYVDTAELALAAAGVTLRRRTGGDDEGWHLKLPAGNGRHEEHRPLGGSADDVPPDLA